MSEIPKMSIKESRMWFAIQLFQWSITGHNNLCHKLKRKPFCRRNEIYTFENVIMQQLIQIGMEMEI